MAPLLLSLFLLTLSLPSLAEDWTGISDCGNYQVSGVVRSKKDGPVIVINEKTQSEITITLPIQNEAKVAPYINKAIAATISFERKPSRTEVVGIIKSIEVRIPNPLDPKDTGIKFLSKVECKK
jgi:hypothetical protein